MKVPDIRLNNGNTIPSIGFGTYKLLGETAQKSVQIAIDAGYRHIDTASYYNNEEQIGEVIKHSDIRRESLFVTSKVWNDEQGFHKTKQALEKSLNKLQTDYLDMYLIHWPRQNSAETWKAMEELLQEGKILNIGVSNFEISDLEKLMKGADIIPVINQIKVHPHNPNSITVEYCRKHSITITAWSPIMRGELLKHSIIQSLAGKYGKTPAQIVLRWHIQNNTIPIPKSSTAERIRENIQIFDFELGDDDQDSISAIGKVSG